MGEVASMGRGGTESSVWRGGRHGELGRAPGKVDVRRQRGEEARRRSGAVRQRRREEVQRRSGGARGEAGAWVGDRDFKILAT